MDPLGVIGPVPISKKSLFGVIILKTTRWYGATFWSLPMKFETSEPWLLADCKTLSLQMLLLLICCYFFEQIRQVTCLQVFLHFLSCIIIICQKT